MKHLTFSKLIIHEDEDVFVINKPEFYASLHERNETNRSSILEMARKYHSDAQLCHRLDKETSGALIIAKHPEACRHLAMQFEKREVNKIYHAVVEGVLPFDNFHVDLPIAVEGKKKVKIDKRNGKPASTYFTAIEHFKHFTLMQCIPVSGRMHQIRIHLASQNARIAGDLLYNGRLPLLSQIKRKYNMRKYQEEENPIFKRVALHSRSITFKNLSDESITVEANYPSDLATFIKILNRYDQSDETSSTR